MNVQAVCKNCETSIEVPYVRLGTSVRCTNCLHFTVPIVPEGTKYPNTGYALSFSDFRGLLEYKHYRVSIKKLINEWFGYSCVSNGQDVLIINDQNESLDKLWLHLRIQESPDLQKKLYRAAMSLWK